MRPTRLAIILGSVVAITLAVVLAFLLPGGTAVQVDTGPLGGGPVDGAECIPGHTVYMGVDAVANTTGSPIQIEKFSLVDARGVKLIAVDLVPIGQVPLIGVGYPYPPSLESKATWDARRAIPMTMPSSHVIRWNLVFGLERTAKTGTLGYAELQYEYGGTQYLWTSQTAVQVVSAASCG